MQLKLSANIDKIIPKVKNASINLFNFNSPIE